MKLSGEKKEQSMCSVPISQLLAAASVASATASGASAFLSCHLLLVYQGIDDDTFDFHLDILRQTSHLYTASCRIWFFQIAAVYFIQLIKIIQIAYKYRCFHNAGEYGPSAFGAFAGFTAFKNTFIIAS